MTPKSGQPSRQDVWRIASRQHDRVTVEQLIELGMTRDAIVHRVRVGKLFRVTRSVLAISRPRGTREERWMTAVLGCGREVAAIGDSSALALYGVGSETDGVTHVSVPSPLHPRCEGVRVRRRRLVLPAEWRVRNFIPVTSPALTIIDNARRLEEEGTESLITAACQKDLLTPDILRAAAERYRRIPGSRLVRTILDRHDFMLTDSELELWFGRIVRRYGFPQPLPQQMVCGFRVDFFWPDLGLIVECDSLRFHRTAERQTRDAERDQIHTAAGYTTMRFTRYQVRHQPEVVAERLAPVIERIAGAEAAI